MGIVTGGEIIVTGVHNVGFRATGIVGLHQFLGNRDGNGFLGTGTTVQKLHLAVQLCRGFLTAFPVTYHTQQPVHLTRFPHQAAAQIQRITLRCCRNHSRQGD